MPRIATKRKTRREHLRDDKHVRRQCRLQHDRHVRGIEELDGVRSPFTTELVALGGDLDAESLEADDEGKNNDSREQVHDVGKPLPPEGLTQRTTFIMPREQEVEQHNDGTFKLGSTANVDGGRGKGLPDDGLADVGGGEQVDAGSETVTFLKEFDEEDDDEGSDGELDDKEKTNTGTEVTWLAI
jgi:hypothetical protein